MRFLNRSNFSQRPGLPILSAGLLLVSGIVSASEPNAPMAMESPALLTGSQEVPPVKTAATARSMIVIGSDLSVTGTVATSGIEGTVAHIHLAPFGINGPPIITLLKTSATQWTVPAGAVVTQAQYDSFVRGDLYVNVHSAANPKGEIRLQLRH